MKKEKGNMHKKNIYAPKKRYKTKILKKYKVTIRVTLRMNLSKS